MCSLYREISFVSEKNDLTVLMLPSASVLNVEATARESWYSLDILPTKPPKGMQRRSSTKKILNMTIDNLIEMKSMRERVAIILTAPIKTSGQEEVVAVCMRAVSLPSLETRSPDFFLSKNPISIERMWE